MKVGIIVGRFETPYIHEGHKGILRQMKEENDRVIVFLGVKEKATKKYPLSFTARQLMILADYPDFTVLPIQNRRCDIQWSEQLDERIERVVSAGDEVTLYGSRDSFIPYYKGKYTTKLVEAKGGYSSTEVREALAKTPLGSLDYRVGVVAGVYNQYPMLMTTVDVAILNETSTEVLLGRKLNANLSSRMRAAKWPKRSASKSLTRNILGASESTIGGSGAKKIRLPQYSLRPSECSGWKKLATISRKSSGFLLTPSQKMILLKNTRFFSMHLKNTF